MSLYLLQFLRKKDSYLVFKEAYTGLEVLVLKDHVKKKTSKYLVSLYRGNLTEGSILRPLGVKEKVYQDLVDRYRKWSSIKALDKPLSNKLISEKLVYNYPSYDWPERNSFTTAEATILQQVCQQDKQESDRSYFFRVNVPDQIDAIYSIRSIVEFLRTLGKVYYLGGGAFRLLTDNLELTIKQLLKISQERTGVKIQILD